MAFTPIGSGQTDAKSPIDEQLMDVGVRQNFDDHEARILSLEGGGGGGGGGAAATEEENRLASVLAGCQTNLAKSYRRVYHVLTNLNRHGGEPNPEGFDPANNSDILWIGHPEVTNAVALYSNELDNRYMKGSAIGINTNGKIAFKLRKGLNYFATIATKNVSGGTVSITINGQTLSTAGITDETYAARTDTFTYTASKTLYGSTEYFFGLDPSRENYVEIEVTTAVAVWPFEGVEVGFLAKPGEFANDLTMRLNPGRLNVRGTSVNVNQGDFTFESGGFMGRTDALKSSNTGTVTVLKGAQPAFTQARAGVNIPFSGGAPTSLSCKSVFDFPATPAFLMIQHPLGEKYIASYTGKTGDVKGSLDGMIWKSAPNVDFTPLNNFTGTNPGDSTGDLSICTWAEGGMHVQAGTNDRVDFQITIDGVQTSHNATIAPGLYSADDLLPIEAAFVAAMEAEKSLSQGQYFLKYDQESHRFVAGVQNNQEVTEIQFLNNTGANEASSFLKQLCGYADADLTGSLSYLATSETEPLPTYIYEYEDQFWSAEDPRILWAQQNTDVSGNVQWQDVQERLGFGSIRLLNTNNDYSCRIYLDDDAAGIILTFPENRRHRHYTVCYNNMEQVYAIDPEGPSVDEVNFTRAKLTSYFYPVPKCGDGQNKQGGRFVTVRMHTTSNLTLNNAVSAITSFVGARQVFTKPAIEALTTTEALIPTSVTEVMPESYFVTPYGPEYSPTTGDNIDTITNTGAWSFGSDGVAWDGRFAQTTTNGDDSSVTFTIAEDGGGIMFMARTEINRTNNAELYIVSGAAKSLIAANLITRVSLTDPSRSAYDCWQFMVRGLPAGQYTASLVNNGNAVGNVLEYYSIGIIDKAIPDNATVAAGIANTRMGISWPMHTRVYHYARGGEERVPINYRGSGYREGIRTMDYAYQDVTEQNRIDDGAVAVGIVSWMGIDEFVDTAQAVNSRCRVLDHCRSLTWWGANNSSLTTSIQPQINGINDANNINSQTATKNGGGSTTQVYTPLYSRHFREALNADMPNSTTINLTDTRGFRVGDVINVYADGQTTEKVKVTAVTAGVSITVQVISNFANFTTANNAYVENFGLHTLDLENQNATAWYLGYFALEPLPLLPSRYVERRKKSLNKIGEVATIFFEGVSNGDDLFYPSFPSDGRPATWLESSISVTAKSDAASTYDIDKNLKDITVSSGTIDIKITAVRRYI